MARQIRLDQIDDVMAEAIQDLVAITTLQWTARVKLATPVETGRLRSGWQTNIKKYSGTIINNVVYAEPVCYGIAKPPSWGGVFRTRQNTVEGFPELIGKELQQYVRRQFGR